MNGMGSSGSSASAMLMQGMAPQDVRPMRERLNMLREVALKCDSMARELSESLGAPPLLQAADSGMKPAGGAGPLGVEQLVAQLDETVTSIAQRLEHVLRRL